MSNFKIFLKFFDLFLIMMVVINLLTIHFLTGGGLKSFSTDEFSSYERIAVLSFVEAIIYSLIYAMAEIHEVKNKKEVS